MKANRETWRSALTIPTYLTLLRIILIPFIALSMMSKAWIIAGLLFVIASLTDMLDGALARSLNMVSPLGTILDPLADKLMLIVVYASLMYIQFIPVPIPLWFFAFVLLNEVLLMAGAFYWSLMKHKIAIQPSRLSKLTGVAQFLFIVWLFVCGVTHIVPTVLFYLMLILISLARACAFLQYMISTYQRISS